MALTGDQIDFVQGGVVTSSAQLVDAGAAVGDVLTVQSDKSIAAAPGGGSQPVKRIVVPITFETANLAAQSFPITAANTGTQKFTIAGNHAALNVGYLIVVTGSTGNNGQHTVVSATNVGGNTEIVVDGTIGDGTADGDLAILTGVVVYTPEENEELIVAYADIRETCDDGGGQQWRLDGGYPDDQSAIGSWDLWTPGDSYDAHLRKGGGGAFPFFPYGDHYELLFTDTAPLRVVAVDQTTGGEPPATTQGQAAIILLIGAIT